MRAIAWVAGVVLWAAAACGAEILGAGACAMGGGGVPSESHGWFVVVEKESSIVYHVPPRRSATPPDGALRGAEDGEVQALARVDVVAGAAAAWEDRLYVVSEAEPGFPNADRRVGSIRAVRTSYGDAWTAEPRGGMVAHPSLPGGRVLSVSAGGGGMAALVERSGGVTLWVLRDRGWVEGTLPAGFVGWSAGRTLALPGSASSGGDRAGSVSLLASGSALELVAVERGGQRAWLATFEARERRELPGARYDPTIPGKLARTRPTDRSGTEPAALEWVELPGAGGGLTARDTWPTMMVVSGVRVAAARDGALVRVFTRVGERWVELTRIPGVAGRFACAGLDGNGRMLVGWLSEEGKEGGGGGALLPGPGRVPARTFREVTPTVWEGSVFTGRSFYVGESRSAAPVASGELRLLAIALVGVMALALAFVLRTEADDAVVVLPAGASLADPGRRAAASGIDLVVAIGLATRIVGSSVGEVMSIDGLVFGKGLVVLAVALVVGAVVGAGCEAVFGRTVGKWLLGCEVVDMKAGVAGHGSRASVWGCVVRNALKWGLPPLTVMAMTDRFGRHMPDRLGRTAVVVWGSEEAGADEDGEG